MSALKPADVVDRVVCPDCGGLCCDSAAQLDRTRHACICFTCCGYAWFEQSLEKTRAFCEEKLRSRRAGGLRSDYPRPVTRQQQRQQERQARKRRGV